MNKNIRDYINLIENAQIGESEDVADGSLNEGQYEMMMRNGQVKKFIAKDDADAKRIAAGYGAKSVIKLKGGVPAGKVAEQGVSEGLGTTPKITFAQQTPGSWTRIDILVNGEVNRIKETFWS